MRRLSPFARRGRFGRPFRSVRSRLVLMFTLAMVVVIVGFGTFLYVRLRSELLMGIDLGLRSRAQALVATVTSASGPSLSGGGRSLVDADEAFAQVLDANGAIVDASSAVATLPLVPLDQLPRGSAPAFRTLASPGFDETIRVLVVRVDRPEGTLYAAVGTNLGDLHDALARWTNLLLVVGPGVLVITAGAGWLLAGGALRPVDRMRSEAGAVTASEASRRLRVPGSGDEIERLAITLNGMLDRLQDALERERRFVDDASHELRTPLSTLRGEIELALARPRENAALIAALESARQDVGHLQRLADDLLVLARSSGGRFPVRRVSTPLNEVIEAAMAEVAPAAKSGRVDVRVGRTEAVADVDPQRLQQAIRNLLENAIRMSAPGQTVEVSVARRDGRILLAVSDEGPGFSPTMLSRAFEPFTRTPEQVDLAVPEGGTGLGLAIVRAVAESHGGTATAVNTPNGARVTLDLPD